MAWYVLREIPKPPYEVTWSGPYDNEFDAYNACPDDPEYGVWPRPADTEWAADDES
jgi:hypothetical protein